MANFVYIATSLDGFIARSDGSVDWLNDIPNPENSDFGFSEFMGRIDAVVLGRATFETAISFDTWIYTKPVYVLSRSLRTPPSGYTDKVEILSGSAVEVTETLKQKGHDNLYIDGGKTIRGFLKADLIDEMIITWIPILLGSGMPLFGDTGRALPFDLIHSEVLAGAMVKSTYRRKQ